MKTEFDQNYLSKDSSTFSIQKKWNKMLAKPNRILKKYNLPKLKNKVCLSQVVNTKLTSTH